MGDEPKKEGTEGEQVTLSKAEVEALRERASGAEKLQQDYEDLKLEVLTPEYMEFLDNKDKGGKQEHKEEKPPQQTGEMDFEKLSKKELFELAVKKAKEELTPEVSKVREDLDSRSKADRAAEVARFARTHEDYSKFRPVMYGLSLDPKNADLALQELYDKAKEHVQQLARPETSPEEKEKQRRMSGEKPGGSSESLQEFSKLGPQEAAAKAMELTKQQLGGIPPA